MLLEAKNSLGQIFKKKKNNVDIYTSKKCVASRPPARDDAAAEKRTKISRSNQ